jgi:hypothetical protein
MPGKKMLIYIRSYLNPQLEEKKEPREIRNDPMSNPVLPSMTISMSPRWTLAHRSARTIARDRSIEVLSIVSRLLQQDPMH